MDPLDRRPDPIDPDALVLIVVGAHLAAERWDRPLATHLAGCLAGLNTTDDPADQLCPMVCTDLWYLNDDTLRRRPTISLGAPDVNALTAYWADKLPSAYTVEGVLTVQLDVEWNEPAVACWGISPSATARAVQAFLDRYAKGFMHRARTGMGR
ncbi:MAG: hypothetical protein KF866_01170 [Phycisphaeraceae bacterium]|nr:hypothetical protein [Phycisphaeraceae bacterium]